MTDEQERARAVMVACFDTIAALMRGAKASAKVLGEEHVKSLKLMRRAVEQAANNYARGDVDHGVDMTGGTVRFRIDDVASNLGTEEAPDGE